MYETGLPTQFDGRLRIGGIGGIELALRTAVRLLPAPVFAASAGRCRCRCGGSGRRSRPLLR